MIHFSCSWIGRNRREVSILESNHKSVKNDVLNLPLEVLDIVWPEAAVATSLDGLTDADTAQTFQILGQFCILSAKPGKDIGKTERNRSWSWFDKSLHSKEYMEQCAAAWQNVGRVFSNFGRKSWIKLSERENQRFPRAGVFQMCYMDSWYRENGKKDVTKKSKADIWLDPKVLKRPVVRSWDQECWETFWWTDVLFGSFLHSSQLLPL